MKERYILKKCMICGKEFKNLGNHIYSKHKILVLDYYIKFLKKNENEGYCLECGSKTKFIGLKSGFRLFCSSECIIINGKKHIHDKAKKLDLKLIDEKYENAFFKHKWKCLKCKYEFNQIWNSIQQGFKCPNCCTKKYSLKSIKKRNKKIKELNLILLDPEYVNNTFKHKWKCLNCDHVFYQVWAEINRKNRSYKCPKCYPRKVGYSQKKKEEYLIYFYKRLKELNLTLLDPEYVDNTVKHKWKCLTCDHVFWRKWLANLKCPKCSHSNRISKGESKQEKELLKFVKSLSLQCKILENTKNILINKKDHRKSLELDIYIPDLKIAFEYNGLYWHSEKYGCGKEYHMKKTLKCEKLGIRLVHIFEDEWILGKENLKMILRKIIKEDWDFLPDYDFHSISLNRRFCKSSEYYEKLGFKVKIINPKLYLNKENFKVWDCGFLELTKL